MTKLQIKPTSFIDFALYIVHAKPQSEFDRLVNEWNTAVDASQTSSKRVKEVLDFAEKEGFTFSIDECRDAVDFWDKFLELEPCLTDSGPVTY